MAGIKHRTVKIHGTYTTNEVFVGEIDADRTTAKENITLGGAVSTAIERPGHRLHKDPEMRQINTKTETGNREEPEKTTERSRVIPETNGTRFTLQRKSARLKAYEMMQINTELEFGYQEN